MLKQKPTQFPVVEIRSGTDHIPVLDGVRGVAVLLVLLVHFIPDVQMSWRATDWIKKFFTTGGWVGVDLFFVLSGFLITGILLRAKTSEHYFRNFYMRRVLRIFPVYYGLLFLTFVVLPGMGLVDSSFGPLKDTQLFHWFYLTNVGWWLLGPDAFGSDRIELRHLWSLAVEEHFYLVWPAVVFFCSIGTIRRVCLGLIISAFCLRCLGSLLPGPHSMLFYLTPFRCDSLAAGALVATLLHRGGLLGLRQRSRVALAVFWSGALTLLAYFLVMKGLWAGHWMIVTVGLSLLAITFSAGIVVMLAHPEGLACRTFSIEPLRFFGKYSYGLYLIHGAMLPTLRMALPDAAWMAHFSWSPELGALSLAVTKIAICTILAVASFHFYEKRFLHLKRFFPAHPTNDGARSCAHPGSAQAATVPETT